MTENLPGNEQIATARIKSRHNVSIVWIVPIVAMLIGAWLAFQAISENGPTITITFTTAEGLEAGKTKIRYKNVEIGQVKSIALSDDISKVIVTASLVKGSESYLTDKTHFWIVRAQVRGGSISGLSTVLSGAYIGIDPVSSGTPTTNFVGLDVPPVVTTGQPGRHFWLRADKLGSVDIGTPVYYRQIQVGQVVSYGFSTDGQSVDIQVFIEAPHHARVTGNTRFWNTSGIDVNLSADGLRINTGTLGSFLSGGLAFDVPNGTPPGTEALDNSVFRLYPDQGSIQEKIYTVRSYWMLLFSQSVRGLSVGAPVELHGIRVGEVVSLDLVYQAEKRDFSVPVVIAIEPERIRGLHDGAENASGTTGPDPRLRRLIEQRGLRAQLKNGNLLTGQLIIDLDLHPNQNTTRLAHIDGYPVIPTIPGTFERIQESLARITGQLEKIPFENISFDLQQTLQATRATMDQVGRLSARLNNETAPQLAASLVEVQKTLGELQAAYGKDSPLNADARKSLDELAMTLRSIRKLADTLEQQPESLIFGKDEETEE